MKKSVFRLGTLTAEEQEILIDTVFPVHKKIFLSPDKHAFKNYVLPQDDDGSLLVIHYNDNGISIGYCFMHFYIKDLIGESVSVLRMEMGTLNQYRRSNRNMFLIIKYTIAYWVKNPRRPFYFLGSLVHPSSYALTTDFVGNENVYPSIININAENDISVQLARSFGMQPLNAENLSVVDVGWITKDEEKQKKYWLSSKKAAVMFFIRNNPDYAKGHGLITVVPVNFKTAKKIIMNFIHRFIQSQIRCRKA